MKIVGHGFRPTDEELVDFYLKHKLLGDSRVNVMPEIDLCDVDPWEVPAMLAQSVIPFNDRKWYFFRRLHQKYSNSTMVNRRTKSGFWKPTGKDRVVKTWDSTTVIGTKKTLVFHIRGDSKDVKTNWVIHEYHALTFHENQKAFVLCHLREKPGKTTKGGTDDEGESSRSVVSECENQAIAEGVPSGRPYTGMEAICREKRQANKCISPVEPSLIDIEHNEASFPNYASNNAYFRNENNIMQIPSETIQIPSETMQIPSETMQIPSETIQIPSETMQIPSETTQIPSETMQIPSETTWKDVLDSLKSFLFDEAPYEATEDVSEDLLAETMEATQVLLSEATKAPLSEAKQIESELTQFSSQTTQSLVIEEEVLVNESLVTDEEAMQAPPEATEALSEVLRAPLSKAIQAPSEDMQILSKTTQTPYIFMQAPSEASFLNLSTQSKSLKRAYCESPYIEAEVVPKLDASLGDISIMYTKYTNSDEYYSSKRFKTSYYVADGDTCLLFSNQEEIQEKQESIFQDDFWGEETSSCDSTTNKPSEINCNEISSFLAF